MGTDAPFPTEDAQPAWSSDRAIAHQTCRRSLATIGGSSQSWLVEGGDWAAGVRR